MKNRSHFWVQFVAVCALSLVAQRAISQSFFVQRTNGVGNWTIRVQNDGTLFNRSVSQLVPGGYWQDPAGFIDTLIFGGGIWVGAERRLNGKLQPAVSFSYEPHMGGNIFVPGSTIYDGPLGDTSAIAVDKYRVYRSDDLVGPPWPVRVTSNGPAYIDDVSQRVGAGSPYVLGDEDMFTLYKDSDSSRYQGQKTTLAAGVEIRTQLSFWKHGDGKDVILVKNAIIHTSDDTLFNPVVALALDGDINYPGDDRLKGVQNEAVHAAVFFSDTSRTDPFLGVVLLAGQHNGRRSDPGMSGLLYWDLSVDPVTDSDRYAFLTTRRLDTATSKVGDARLLLASSSTEPLIGKDTLYFDYALFAVANEGRPALAPEDSARVLDFATEITNDYYSNRLSALSVPFKRNGPTLEDWAIYPNPASSTINFEFATRPTGSLHIYDELGREVQSLKIAASSNRISLNLTNFPTGLFFVRVDGMDKGQSFEHLRGF